jgi:hypothetical protein
MTIKTKFAAVAVAALVHGFHPGWAIGAGLLGAAVVGSAIAASQPYPYGYSRCGYVRQFDAWGNPYLVRTCY